MAPEVQTTPCPHCGKHYGSSTRICPDDGSVIEHASPLVGQVGTVLDGKYRLDGFLSHGGMGAVYRATHVMLGKTVAVKLINPELVTSPEIVRRFQREARAATALNHFNIVAVYDLGQTSDGTLYIAMEFINGPSLKEAIQQSHGLAPERAIALLRQIASALSKAHRNAIIHRDLKPHNVMLASGDDGREIVKLVDFGIAKTFDEGTKLTSTGFPIGTPHYMPPEQASGGVVDARSDLYSVGVILYEMLTGNVPFDGDSTPVILIKHIKEPPIAPSLKASGSVPAALDAIALRLLQKDPANRFQSADELAAALDQAAATMETTGATRPMVPATGASAAAAPTVPRPSSMEPTVIASAAATADATVPMPPTGDMGVTVPLPARAAAPAPTSPRAQAPTPAPPVPSRAPAPTAGPPAPTPVRAAVAPQPAEPARTVGAPAAAPAASVQRPPEPMLPPPPPLVPNQSARSKSSSVVVLSVLGLGIIAALGAAYYLNSLAGRSGSPAGGATATAPPPSASVSTPAAPPDSPASQPAQASASLSTASAVPPAPPPPEPPAAAPPATAEANRPPTTPAAGSGAKLTAESPAPSLGKSQPTSSGRQSAGNAPPPPGAPIAGASARGRSTIDTGRSQTSTSAAAATVASGNAPVRGSAAGGAAARREEPVQTAAGFPEKPAVYFRCTGPAEICNPLRTAVDDALENAGLTSVRRANAADVDVSAQVEVVQENVDRQFGQTFATRSYSVVLNGETTKTGEVVAMPSVSNFSFDQRVGSERAVERSRLISSALVERVKEFAAKKRR